MHEISNVEVRILPRLLKFITMRKFNLKDWQQGAKVCTRSGFEVDSLTYFPNAKDYKLAGMAKGDMHTWTDSGLWDADRNDSPLDLVLEEQEQWVYSWKGENGRLFLSTLIYPTLEEAANMAKATLKPEEFGGIYKLEPYDIFDIQ